MLQKTVLVTGGTRSIGLAISFSFAKAGYNVAMNYKNDDAAAEEALSEILKVGSEATIVKADISTQQGRSNLLLQTLDKFGKIDALINNAGIAQRSDFLDTDENDYEREINCNLTAPVLMAQAVAKHMVESNVSGNIINICSIAGHHGLVSLGYAASKAGLLAATKLMARELAQHQIRVNSVSPGPIRTDINKNLWQGKPEEWQKMMEPIALKRAGKPDEVSNVVFALASDEFSYVTGADIIVDGGFLN